MSNELRTLVYNLSHENEQLKRMCDSCKYKKEPLPTQLPKHLGGHANITHTDEGALLYLKKTFNIDSMLDVGCGPGGMLSLAKKHDIIAVGVDGDYTVERDSDIVHNVIIHDFTKGNPDIQVYFDLVWSVEFLEHVEERFLPFIFNAFKMGKYVFCTANAGGGHHHVNKQDFAYWHSVFTLNNFEFMPKETDELKAASTMKREFVRKTGMIWKNKLI